MSSSAETRLPAHYHICPRGEDCVRSIEGLPLTHGLDDGAEEQWPCYEPDASCYEDDGEPYEFKLCAFCRYPY